MVLNPCSKTKVFEQTPIMKANRDTTMATDAVPVISSADDIG